MRSLLGWLQSFLILMMQVKAGTPQHQQHKQPQHLQHLLHQQHRQLVTQQETTQT
jgi:hypothetical protein